MKTLRLIIISFALFHLIGNAQNTLIKQSVLDLFYNVPLGSYLYDVRKIIKSNADIYVSSISEYKYPNTEDTTKIIKCLTGVIKNNNKLHHLPTTSPNDWDRTELLFYFNEEDDILYGRDIQIAYEQDEASKMDDEMNELNDMFSKISFKAVKKADIVEKKKRGDIIEFYATEIDYINNKPYLEVSTIFLVGLDTRFKTNKGYHLDITVHDYRLK